MLLADVLTNYRDEAEADLQQVYGVDLELAGQRWSYSHVGALLAQLPENSRTKMAARRDEPWGDEVLLCSIANSLRALPAALSGKKGALAKVRMLGPRQGRTGSAGRAMPRAEFDRIMTETMWKEAPGGEH